MLDGDNPAGGLMGQGKGKGVGTVASDKYRPPVAVPYALAVPRTGKQSAMCLEARPGSSGRQRRTGGSGESLGRQSSASMLQDGQDGRETDGLSVHQALFIRTRVCNQACSTEAPAFQRGTARPWAIPSPLVGVESRR